MLSDSVNHENIFVEVSDTSWETYFLSSQIEQIFITNLVEKRSH